MKKKLDEPIKPVSPQYVYDAEGLERAITNKKIVIVSNDKQFFHQLETEIQKSRKIKKGGALLAKISAPIAAASLFIPVVNIAVIIWTLAGSGVILGGYANLVSTLLNQFKNYSVVLDDKNEQIIFVKVKGKPKYDAKTMYVIGIDFKKLG